MKILPAQQQKEYRHAAQNDHLVPDKGKGAALEHDVFQHDDEILGRNDLTDVLQYQRHTIILLVSYFVFDVPIVGSLWLLLGLSLIFILMSLWLIPASE